MNSISQQFVVDASVVIKLLVKEKLSDLTDVFFSELKNNPLCKYWVPDLCFIECANILWKYVRRYGLSSIQAHQQLRRLMQLELHVVSAAEIINPALKIALDNKITAYDACYVALALEKNCSLITADEKLIRQLHHTGYPVSWIGDILTAN